ncbi:hypothetical protein [Bathymodiolus japonicus methanotrophic gill symbiont]|uniref:hypothetical protein n=1 Tax=Bathymodiolus japonicus methanotrophic gill symbiont TaxID=113269 RepID=UPI001C8D467D|nr:hypothetical protein [Bathymodiolus japonicus methanotrophic gill symbiont]
MCSVCGGRRAAGASPIRCVGERITATGVPEFREVAWRACIFLGKNISYQLVYHSGSSKRNNNRNVFTVLYELSCGKVSFTASIDRGTLMLSIAML